MKQRLNVFCLVIIASLIATSAHSQQRKPLRQSKREIPDSTFHPPTFDDPFDRMYNRSESTQPLAAPVDESYSTSYSEAGTQIKIFKDPSTNCESDISSCKIYYTPLVYFQRDPDSDVVKTKTEFFEKNAVVSVFVQLNTRGLQNIVLKKANQAFGKTFSVSNLEPLPLTYIMMVPRDLLLPDAMKNQPYAKYPESNPATNTKAILDGKTIQMRFVVPIQEAERVREKFERGRSFNVRYEYISRAYAENKKSTHTSIEMDQKLIRDLTGGRDRVYASKSQIMDLAMRSVIQQADNNYIENSEIIPIFQEYSTKLLDSILGTETTLGKIHGELISSYKLNDSDKLMTPNTTTEAKQIYNDKYEEHTILHQIYDSMRSYGGSVSGGALWGMFSGDAEGSYAKSNKTDVERNIQKSRDIQRTKDWKGEFIEPLNIKLYEVSTAKLSKSIELNAKYVIAGANGTSTLSTVRSTVDHLGGF